MHTYIYINLQRSTQRRSILCPSIYIFICTYPKNLVLSYKYNMIENSKEVHKGVRFLISQLYCDYMTVQNILSHHTKEIYTRKEIRVFEKKLGFLKKNENFSKYGNPGRSNLDRSEVKLRFLKKNVKCWKMNVKRSKLDRLNIQFIEKNV